MRSTRARPGESRDAPHAKMSGKLQAESGKDSRGIRNATVNADSTSRNPTVLVGD